MRAPCLCLAVLLATLDARASDPPTATADPSTGARDDAVRLLRRILAGEPRVEAVQRAASARAASGAGADAEGWRRRSRLAALVPRLVAEYRHDERSYRVVGLSSGSEVDYLRTTPGDAVSVRLDFDLPGLVFGRRELESAAAEERVDARRRAAVERATRLYYDRLRLRLALAAAPPSTARARAEAEIDLDAVTAELDGLTGLYGEAAP